MLPRHTAAPTPRAQVAKEVLSGILGLLRPEDKVSIVIFRCAPLRLENRHAAAARCSCSALPALPKRCPLTRLRSPLRTLGSDGACAPKQLGPVSCADIPGLQAAVARDINATSGTNLSSGLDAGGHPGGGPAAAPGQPRCVTLAAGVLQQGQPAPPHLLLPALPAPPSLQRRRSWATAASAWPPIAQPPRTASSSLQMSRHARCLSAGWPAGWLGSPARCRRHCRLAPRAAARHHRLHSTAPQLPAPALQPNFGELSTEGLGGQLRANAERGIFTTIVGVGLDFNSGRPAVGRRLAAGAPALRVLPLSPHPQPPATRPEAQS